MKFAVMSSLPSERGAVPDCFEASPVLLIWETDTDSVSDVYENKKPEEFSALVVSSRCEAVVCGPHIGKDCFDPIADAGVTRYDGAGLSVPEAAAGALSGALPIIREYEGGPGCSAGQGSCEENGCGV